MIKPMVKPPAQSKSFEQHGVSGPTLSITAASSDPPQHKQTVQKDSTGDWLSASSCLEPKVEADFPVASKGIFTASVSSHHIHKKTKKIGKGHQRQIRLHRTYFRKGIPSAVSKTRLVSPSSITRAIPTLSAKPIVESSAKPFAIQATCAHPLMAADSEAEELQKMQMPMPLGERNIPTEPDFEGSYPRMRQVPHLLTLRTEQQAVPLESSTESSIDCWDELSDIFSPNIDDEILWGRGNTSNDVSVFGTGMGSTIGTFNDTLVGGSMSPSGSTSGTNPTTECGVQGAAWLLNGWQQKQHQHLPEHRVGANISISRINGLDGCASPISSWTQEAVEAGASTLLAVLADGDTSPSFLGNNAIGIAGARRQTGPSPPTTWPMNFNNNSDISVHPLPMGQVDPCSRQLPSSLQTGNLQNVTEIELLAFEGTTRRWAMSKPNLTTF